MADDKYNLTISRNTVDKLGVKLYDKASDVVSELISNAYDADAEAVLVTAPLGEFLATKKDGKVTSKDLKIVVEDDGHGFSEDEANSHYLKIGNDRRLDPDRGPKSRERHRPVMGRKGIGKLAAFGICRIIEVWSASGKKDSGRYPVSHFILRYEDITQDTDAPYHPKPGPEDGSFSLKRGTKITLSNFLYKKVPDAATFRRQLARKFGIGSADFKISVTDSETKEEQEVSGLDVDVMVDTKIELDGMQVPLEGEDPLPVSGWIAYAKHSYENEEVAGVRIYARGKLAAHSRDFGRKTGFTGEYTIRTYMVGEIHAEWLDEEEDLIASDRQDILWSSDKGLALQKWGTGIMEDLGKKSRKPMEKKTLETFMERSRLASRAKEMFGDTSVYEAAMYVGTRLSKGIGLENLRNDDYVQSLLELILSIAPHQMIVDKLKNIADEENKNPLNTIATLFGDVKLAEAASLGQVALEKLRAIKRLKDILMREEPAVESELQKLLENASWLISPQWTVLQADQTFNTFKETFGAWYKNKTGGDVNVTFEGSAQRPDFIMFTIESSIEIVEIKRPGHKLDDAEFRRLTEYIEKMDDYLRQNNEYETVHATLVCDDLNLDNFSMLAYKNLSENGRLRKKTWENLLSGAVRAHEDFLNARDDIFKNSRSHNSG